MPTRPGACDAATITENDAKATRAYRPVPNVHVTARDEAAGTITISAMGTDGRDHSHTLPWGREDVMWVYCPSSLPSEAIHPDPGPLPAVGAVGVLYIEQGFLNANSIMGGTPKWPLRLLEPAFSSELPIRVKSLVLTGVELTNNGETIQATVDLMDRKLAPEQTLVIGDGAMMVRLTQKGFDEFIVAFPAHKHLAEAVRIIEERKDPARIARAWEIVATCKTRIDKGLWPGPNADKSALSKLQEVEKLIARVLP